MANIKEFAKQGISKIRKPEWNEFAYLEIELLEDGNIGAWCKLYDYAGSGSYEPINIPVALVWSEDYVPHLTPTSSG
jgi:hypothetical protein